MVVSLSPRQVTLRNKLMANLSSQVKKLLAQPAENAKIRQLLAPPFTTEFRSYSGSIVRSQEGLQVVKDAVILRRPDWFVKSAVEGLFNPRLKTSPEVLLDILYTMQELDLLSDALTMLVPRIEGDLIAVSEGAKPKLAKVVYNTFFETHYNLPYESTQALAKVGTYLSVSSKLDYDLERNARATSSLDYIPVVLFGLKDLDIEVRVYYPKNTFPEERFLSPLIGDIRRTAGGTLLSLVEDP